MIKLFTKKRKGFTLIELVVVIAILGILMAIAVPRFTSMTQNAKVTADGATARNIAGALNVAIADGNAVILSNTITFSSRAADASATPPVAAITGGNFTGTAAIGKLTEWGYLDTINKTQSTSNDFTIVITNSVLTITDGAGKTFYPSN